MSSTGPTGSAWPTPMFPTVATGTVEAPHIATLDELMASHAAIVAKENTDKQTLSVLNSNLRDLFRAPLFQWAAAGFPDIYIVKTFTILPPPICSDGVTRGMYEYINYCLDSNLDTIMDNIRLRLTGITLSTSIADDILRFHVSKS